MSTKEGATCLSESGVSRRRCRRSRRPGRSQRWRVSYGDEVPLESTRDAMEPFHPFRTEKMEKRKNGKKKCKKKEKNENKTCTSRGGRGLCAPWLEKEPTKSNLYIYIYVAYTWMYIYKVPLRVCSLTRNPKPGGVASWEARTLQAGVRPSRVYTSDKCSCVRRATEQNLTTQ